MNLMPILYVPKSRYTNNTNVLIPLIVNFLRAAAIMMLDWVTLRFVDHAPVFIWIITGVIAIAVLAVLQSKDWLDFKGAWYFTSSLGGLLLVWFGVLGYAYWAYHSLSEQPTLFPTADEIGEAVARHLPKASAPGIGATFSEPIQKSESPPRSKQAINELLEESGALQRAIEKGPDLNNEWRSTLTTQGLNSICHDPQAVQDKIKSLAERLDSAHREIGAVYEKNAIDVPEFSKIFGTALNTPGPDGFGKAAQVLRVYGRELNFPGDPCDSILTSNILISFSTMVSGMNDFGVWLGKTDDSLSRYRNNLRTELRNAL